MNFKSGELVQFYLEDIWISSDLPTHWDAYLNHLCVLIPRCTRCPAREISGVQESPALCLIPCWRAHHVSRDQQVNQVITQRGDINVSSHQCTVSGCYQVSGQISGIITEI